MRLKSDRITNNFSTHSVKPGNFFPANNTEPRPIKDMAIGEYGLPKPIPPANIAHILSSKNIGYRLSVGFFLEILDFC